MAKRTKKGLPKSIAEAIEREEGEVKKDETFEGFITEMHGTPPPVNAEDDGWPTKEWLQGQFSTKSAIIRYLRSQGKEVKDIAKRYGFKYQMVRNISTNELKRGPNEDWRKPYLDQTNLPDIKKFEPEK